MAPVGRTNVAGRRACCVDFHDRRIRTTWAWSCDCNDYALPEATGAASRQWAHKASLEVRVQCLAARNQAFCL